MHTIEDAARLAMGGVLAGGPTETAPSRPGYWIPGIAIVLVGLAVVFATIELF